MKKILPLIMPFVLIMFISGCGENMFAAGGNDQSPEAKESIVLKAFMDKDYDKILSLYSNNYSTFSNEDAYNYVSALLGKGGFDILNGIDYFLGSNQGNTDDMYSMFYTLIGINNTTANSQYLIDNAKRFFDEAAIVCNTVSCIRLGGQFTYNPDGTTSCSVKATDSTINSLDNNTAFVCSLSGGFGTVTNVSNTVKNLADIAGINIDGIDITSQAGLSEVINQIQTNGNGTNLEETVKQLNDEDIKDLANTLNNLNSNISNLESIVGNVSEVDQLFEDFVDTGTGDFTTESVRNGLNQYLTGIGGTQN